MAVRVGKRAEVSEEFATYYKMYLEKLFKEKKVSVRRTSGALKREEAAILLSIGKRLWRDPSNPRSGFDYEMTRLRNTKGFTRFYAGMRGERVFLCGKTEEIIMSSTKPGVERRWRIGKYNICIPLDRPDAFHLIPIGREHNSKRHPHHLVRSGIKPGENPLDVVPNSCTSQFSSIIFNMAGEGDIVGLFHLFHRFVSEYWPGDTLCTPNEMQFPVRLS